MASAPSSARSAVSRSRTYVSAYSYVYSQNTHKGQQMCERECRVAECRVRRRGEMNIEGVDPPGREVQTQTFGEWGESVGRDNTVSSWCDGGNKQTLAASGHDFRPLDGRELRNQFGYPGYVLRRCSDAL